MKKLLYLLLIISCSILAQCKKNADLIPDPGAGTQPGTVEPPAASKASDFLKKLVVTGAEKVAFDSVRNAFYVSLPDTYNASKAELKLSLAENIFLWDSAQSVITKDSVIRYSYQGTSPLSIKLSDDPEKTWAYFTVFFNFSGTPQIELLSKEIPMDARGSNLPVRFLAKVGSIPASLEEPGTTVKITNRKTGATAESFLYSENNNYVNFGEPEKFITGDPIALEFNLFNQKPVVFEDVKFLRGLPQIQVAFDYKVIYAPKDTIKIGGGFFIPAAKYTARFSNDYLATPVSVNVKYINIWELNATQLPALPEGSYLVSFYENETLMGRSAIHLSSSDKASIESVWKGSINAATERNVNQLTFNRGDKFYAKVVPVLYGYGQTTVVDVSKLASIRLELNGKTVALKPELETFNWAIAGINYPVGKYTIPSNLTPGFYKVTAISPDGKETKPYWSKMQVR